MSQVGPFRFFQLGSAPRRGRSRSRPGSSSAARRPARRRPRMLDFAVAEGGREAPRAERALFGGPRFEDLAVDQRLPRRRRAGRPRLRPSLSSRRPTPGLAAGAVASASDFRRRGRLPAFAGVRRLLRPPCDARPRRRRRGEADPDRQRRPAARTTTAARRGPASAGAGPAAGGGAPGSIRWRPRSPAGRRAAPILVGEPLPVEPEVGGVGADEAAGVGAAGQGVPLLVLHRPQVAGPDLGRRLDLGEVEFAPIPRLSQSVCPIAPSTRDIVAIWPLGVRPAPASGAYSDSTGTGSAPSPTRRGRGAGRPR